MDINISNLPVCYLLPRVFLSFSLEMGKISAYRPFNGYQYFQPTHVLLPRFFFCLSLWKWYQYFQPTRVLLTSKGFFFFGLSHWKAPLNMEHLPPSIHSRNHSTFTCNKPFQHSNKNPFCD
jgi:hypothetical protein